MDPVREIVVHERFGRGVITAFDGHCLIVSFEQGGERRFSYPSAFERFLKAENPVVQAEADDLLRRRQAEAAANAARIEEDIAALRAAARKAPSRGAPAPRKSPAPRKTARSKAKQ